MSTRREAFAAGVAAVVPMLPGIAPFGLVAGLTAIATGLSSVQALALSGLVFAGASQLALLQLLADGAVPAVILLTVLTVNLRFAMYSASLAPHFQHLGRRWRWPLAYLMVDQNYALTIQRYHHGDPAFAAHGHWFYLGGGAALWLTWQAATAVGVFMGASVPRAWSLDFAIPLVFMVLLVPALRDRAHVVAALTGGLVATVAADLPLHLGIVAGAFSGIAAGMLAERRRPRA
ncbi:MAG TPA: AzlC family ABC transporter permease [Gammaproteobacteria bacterium]